MTLKKQFVFLGGIVISIPLLFLFFICVQNYMKSSERFLMSGAKEIRKMDDSRIKEKDWNYIERLKFQPNDVECLLLSLEDNKIIYSSISDFKPNMYITDEKLWSYINNTSRKYFYQFTAPPIEQKALLLTRVPRIKKRDPNQTNLMIILWGLLGIVSVSVILIIIISRTLFKSIKKIQYTTSQIADGNLNVEIPESSGRRTNELTAILQSLGIMRDSLLEAETRKNKFIMGISHDLRTPVAIIKGYTEAIKDGVISDKNELNSTLTLIESKTTQLEDMIDTLINYTKMNNREMMENLVPGDIAKLIRFFAKDSKILATAFKRNIICDINLPESIMIPLNSQLAQRSFENLFSNALRYTKDDDTIKIISYIDENENAIKLKIEDTGIGIEEKDLNNIFDLFYRGTNSRREEGMGIGLAVVKTIVNTLGWQIAVDSKKDEGTCFTITMPL
ncbi:MAG: HAMP domain-containing histidine kinase [Treponema sp.]|nr:HAMP domain-containing histidine kinase [Treponema sp.]